MNIQEEMRAKLTKAFEPELLDVINESHRHAGHAGDDGSGESHWQIRISATPFAGQSRVGRERAIHTALGADIIGRIHALAIAFV